MQNRKYAMIAMAAAAASLPLTGKAATITFAFDPTILVSTDGGYTFHSTPVVTTGINQTVTVAPGSFIEVSVDGDVTGNTNTAPAGSNTPTNLGLDAFTLGVTDNKSGTAGIESYDYFNGATTNGNQTTAVVNSIFGAPFPGTIDGNGGITTSTGILGSVVASSATATQLAFANGPVTNIPTSAGSLATQLFIGPNQGGAQTNGTAVFTLNTSNSGTAYYTYKSGGVATKTGTSAVVYQGTQIQGTDTVNLGTLSVVVGVVPSNQPIISLTASSGTTSAPTTYNTQDGTISILGNRTIGYAVSTASNFSTATTGYTVASPFTAGDPEIYALKLSNASGGALSPTGTQVALIISDINGGNGNTAAVGVTASAVTGSYSNLFPGYDILLTSTTAFNTAGTASGSTGSYLGFDFSSGGEQDAADTGITVTGIAAVPEPATAAGVVLGAAGLLLGRRRKVALA